MASFYKSIQLCTVLLVGFRLMKMYRRPCSVPRTLILARIKKEATIWTLTQEAIGLKIFIKKLFGRGNTSQPLDGGKILVEVPNSRLPLQHSLVLEKPAQDILSFVRRCPKSHKWVVLWSGLYHAKFSTKKFFSKTYCKQSAAGLHWSNFGTSNLPKKTVYLF